MLFTDGMAQDASTFRDIKVDLTQLQDLGTGSDVFIKVAENGAISQTDNAEEANATLKGNWHSTNYGWSNFTASVPVQGCVKITYATHDYGNDITVTNTAGEQVAKFNTTGPKWSSSPDNVVVAYYRSNIPTVLTFSKANYNPYFAVEAIDEADLPAEVTTYNITFAAGEGVGTAPGAIEVQAGQVINAPKNYSLYAEGKTLTGWSDGTKTYAIGEDITPEGDMTLTAQYEANSVGLEDRTSEITLSYPLSGYNDNPKYNIQKATGIIVTQATINNEIIDVPVQIDATNGKFTYNGSGWHQVNAGTKVTVPSCKDATIAVSTYNDVASVTFNGAEGTADGNTAKFTATTNDATVEIAQASNNYWNSLTITLPAEDEGGEGPEEFIYRDFQIDPLGDLLTADEKEQGKELNFSVVVNEDGSQTRVAAGTENANVMLSGTYHNDHGWRNFKATVPVDGPIKITMSTCSWGSDVTVKDADGKLVTTFTTQKGEDGSGCYGGNGLQDENIVSAEYKGEATVLVINGGGYVNFFAIEAIEGGDDPEPVAEDKTATWNYGDETIMTATMALSGSTEEGTVECMEQNGVLMTILANGASFRNNGNNIQVRKGAEFRVPVGTTDDVVTIKGYPSYSYYSINGGAEITNTNDNPQTEYKVKNSDVERGYVSIVSTNDNNYFYSIKVDLKAPKEPTTLDNEAVTATFPFDLGTEGQKATFSNADYFLTSKVTVGSNLTIKDKSTLTDAETSTNVTQTRLWPTTKLDKADEASAVRFIITPKPGFTFTPTRVALNATRYGTDNGKIDVAWEVAGGDNIVLATAVSPNRNNKNPNISKLSYDIENATPAEGNAVLLLHLYGLQENKQFGLNDIVIEGTLSGTEKEVPILASYTLNGVEYQVEDVFGDAYEAEFELSKKDQMVGPNNPLTNITATSGELGEVSYKGDDTQCVVTIPVSAGETTLEYVLNVIQKPDFTLTYFNTDGTEMGTQLVEKDATIGQFDVNYEGAKAAEGMKVRGWFERATGGRKFTTDDVITSNVKLYAVATEIEVCSDSKKYEFNLADPTFYAEDHEAFVPGGEGYYFHDATHGWAFKNGNTIDLLVGPKASIFVTVCQYGSGTGIVVKKGEEVLETLAGKSEADAGVVAYNYEGEAGTITLEMQCSGEMYVHGIKIANTSTTNYVQEGQWYFVKAGDVSSFLDALDAANGSNGVAGAPRVYIYLPNGDYNLGERCLTPVSGNNISIIGESQEGVIIRNLPVAEGIGTTATLKNSGTGNYYQDLTIKNEWDYYGRILAGDGAGRAVCIQETGNNTICKNVTLLSYQDTYYTNNANGNYYWEDSEIHGTVDFICGEGTLFLESSKLVVEKRNPDGSGECTLTAPSTAVGKNYGYVFNNCTIENYAAKYNYGRAWNNEPRCAYLNTTVNDNKINTNRWTPNGMNVVAKEFVEYNTKDEQGSVVSPASNVVTFTYGSKSNEMETILTADQAANFTLAKVFGNWGPDNATKQVEAPQNGKMEGNTISWDAVTGAVAYFIYDKEGKLMGETTETTYTIEDQAAGSKGFETTETVLADSYIVRAANAMGGLGEPAIISKATAITNVNSEVNGNVVKTELYNLQGVRVVKNYKGAAIRVQTMDNGQTTTQKVIMK